MGQSEQIVLRWPPGTGGSLRLCLEAVVARVGGNDATARPR